MDSGGDDRLGTGARESSLDSVDRERRVSHPAHEGGALVVTEHDLGASRALKVGHGDIDNVVAGLLLGGEGGDLVGDSWDEHLSGGGDELGEDGKEVGHGLVYHASVYTTVEVGTRSLDRDLEVGESPETVGCEGSHQSSLLHTTEAYLLTQGVVVPSQ